MTLTCVVIDDEYLAIRILEDYVSKNEHLHLLRTFKYPTEAIGYLQQNKVDVLFLDIQMPELDGFAVLSKLPDPPTVIFTTARPDYAVRAYELDVLDYLLKPISIDRFNRAVDKAVEFARYISISDKQEENTTDYIMINADFQIHKIKFKDIFYIEGLSEYVKIHCVDGNNYVTLASLKNMEEKLNGFSFVRVHKSFIVNQSRIKSFSHSEIVMKNEKVIPIGRVYKKDVIAELTK